MVYTDWLIAYYNLDWNANDVSGNWYNWTVVWAYLNPDRNWIANKAYKFDWDWWTAWTDYSINLWNTLIWNQEDFTIMQIVKPNSISSRNHFFRRNSEFLSQIVYNAWNRQLEFAVYRDSDLWYYRAATNTLPVLWQYFVLACKYTYDVWTNTSTMKMYNNWIMVATSTFTGIRKDIGTWISMGISNLWKFYPLIWVCDEFIVFNKWLSDSDILLYSQTQTIPTANTLWYTWTPRLLQTLTWTYNYSGIINEWTSLFKRYKNWVLVWTSLNYTITDFSSWDALQFSVTPVNRVWESWIETFGSYINIISDTNTSIVPNSSSTSWTKLLIKVYEHERINTVLAQELIDSEVEIDDNLTSFSVAKFSCPLMNIQEDNKIEIYEIWNTDKRVFVWYIYKVEPVRNQFWILHVECRSERALFEKRLLLKTQWCFNVKSFSALPVYPAPYEYETLYRVNQNVGWAYFYERTEFPKSSPVPAWWTPVPPPPPYYVRGYTPFVETTFAVDSATGHVYRVENWAVTNLWTWTGVMLSNMIADLCSDYQQYWENWTYEMDFDDTIDIQRSKWDTYAAILDQMAEQTDAVRDVKDWKVSFKKILWSDYTSWPWYKEIIYNWLYPNTWNTKSISVIWTATRNNIIMATDVNNNMIINDSWYVDRIYGVMTRQYRSWKLSLNAQKMLQNNNIQQRSYVVEVEQNTLDVNIWDKIKLVVENTNSYFDIDSEVYINWKITKYTNASKMITYSVWEMYVQPINTENWLYGMQKDIKLLKLY